MLLLVLAVAWHLVGVGHAWSRAQDSPHGRDFATYYYAAEVVLDGQDPYDRRALGQASRADRTRGSVFPFLYPPTFLLALLPLTALSLKSAYLLWFWLGEAALALSAVALARWLGRRETEVTVAVVGLIALATAFPNNLLMGQANLPVLALTLCALWQADRGRAFLAGPLLGVAIALKLSPVLVLGWWLVRGRFREVATALATVLVLLGISVLVFGPGALLTFATEVVPSLSDGSYNELRLPVALFGNHSVPNLWHLVLPAGGRTLGVGARVGSLVTNLVLVGIFVVTQGPGRSWPVRRATSNTLGSDPGRRDIATSNTLGSDPGGGGLRGPAQVAGLLVLGLLLPVFTYEHHLVWALPAAVVAVMAVVRGELHPFWALPVGLALAAWAADLSVLKAWAQADGTPLWLVTVLRESKFGALFVLFAAMLVLGRGPWPRPWATRRADG